MSRRGWVLFTTMCVVWGVPYLLIKVAVEGVTPAGLVFWRTAIGAVLLLPLAGWRRQLRPLVPRWRILVVYTVVEIAVPWLLLSDAERRLSSSLSGLIVAAVPLIGALLARLTGSDERLGPRRLVGLATGFAGVAALLGLAAPHGEVWSIVEVALVAVGYATGPLIIARRLSDLPSLGVVAVSLGLCATAYAPAGLTELPGAIPPTRVVAAVAVLGVVCTAVAFLLFFALVAEAGPVRATVITYVNPAVAVALGVAVLGEPFTAGTALGFALIVTGSFLSTRPSRAAVAPAGGAVAVEPGGL